MKIKRRAEASAETSMASMSDIAFLLIIFFMISSAFIFNEGLHLVLPDNEKKPVIVSKKNIIFISLLKEGKIIINEKDIDKGKVEKLLEESKYKNPEVTVLLKIHRDVIYSETIEMIDKIKSARIKRFSLKMI
jgi:biopolymer transport protein ExbD